MSPEAEEQVRAFSERIARTSQTDDRPISVLIDELLPTTKLSNEAKDFFLRYGIVAYLNDLKHRYVTRGSEFGRAPWYHRAVVRARAEDDANVPIAVRVSFESADGERIVVAAKATPDDWWAFVVKERAQVNAARRRVRAALAILALLEEHRAKTIEELPEGALKQALAVLKRGWT